ncbi:hypothetical protein [Endozoicomonas sp.]|uniref:hypothetical protein n=1 Tax=Endozoicomonas sp. TaxID=1892382 RepID=UPI003AF723F7
MSSFSDKNGHHYSQVRVVIPQAIAERQLKLFGQVHKVYEAGIRMAMAMSGQFFC